MQSMPCLAGLWTPSAAVAPIRLSRRIFFSEEKKQKTFGLWRDVRRATYAPVQKFFGSFFQKRTCFLQ
jgi:hypothetical protein